MASFPTALLTIDLDALAHNLAVLRDAAGGAEVAPVIKADGYGLGLAQVGRRLRAEGVRSFFVAHLAEGEALRAALGPQGGETIHVLDGFTPGSGPRMAAARLIPALSSRAQIDAGRAHAATSGQGFDVALHVDTGMNRQGLTPDEASALAAEPHGLHGLSVGLVMSHLGSAASPEHRRNADQLAAFQAVRALFPQARASLAASAGIFLGPEYLFDLVRPGISLFGGGPLERPDERFRAVATLQAPLLDIREARAGAMIGYGSSVVLPRPMRLGVVSAGYADGVIRSARGAGYAWVAEARRPLVVVNMNMLVVDLGDAVVEIGHPVELLGANVLLDDLAAAAGSVAHECLVRLSARAERRYVGAV